MQHDADGQASVPNVILSKTLESGRHVVVRSFPADSIDTTGAEQSQSKG